MKHPIILLLLSISISTYSQTYTTAKLSDSMRAQGRVQVAQGKTIVTLTNTITAILAKLEVKDNNDDLRNVQIKTLNVKQDSLKKAVDKMSFDVSDDFIVDTTNRRLYINSKDDTVVIKRMKVNPLSKVSSTGNTAISKGYVDDLKFQIQQLEKSVGVMDKAIARLHKELKKERAKSKQKK